MTAEEVAEQIIAAIGRPDFQARLQEMRPELSLNVILLLHRRANSYNLRNPRRSLGIAEAAGEAAALLGTPEAYALVDWARGNALFHHSEYAAALAPYRRAESVYQQLDRPLMVAKLQINQIAALRGTGAHHAAIEIANRTRTTYLAAGEAGRRDLALLDMNLGAIHFQLGEFDTALAVLERGRAALVALGDDIETARIDINRANVLQELGRFAETESILRESLRVLEAGGYNQEAATANFNRGTLAYRRGNYQSALRCFEDARTGFTAVENDGDIAMVDLFRSSVYRDLNLLRETVLLAADAEKTMKRDSAGWLHAQAQINQGVAYRRLGVWHAAEQYLLRARRNLQSQGAANRVLTLDLERAYLALETGHPARARRIALRVARSLVRQNWPELDAEIELLLARCDLALVPPDLRSARQRAERALAIAQTYGLPARVTALWLIGRSQALAGSLDNAWQALHNAMEAVEQARALLPIDELSTSFMEDKHAIFADAVRLSCSLRAPARLLYTLDRAAAAPFPRLRASAAVDGELQSDQAAGRLRELRELWYWQQSRADTAGVLQGVDTAPEAESRSSIHRLEDEIAELTRRTQIRARGSEQQRAQHESELDEHAFLATIHEHLSPREALLQYFEDDGDVGVIIVTQSGVQLQPELTTAHALHRLLGAWRLANETQQLVAAGTRARGTLPHLRRMYDWLVRPLSQQLEKIECLSIVLPPGFHDLPFAAFFSGASYLVEHFVISYVSAAGALLTANDLARTKPAAPAAALIVGYSDGGRLPHTLAEARAVQAALESSMSTTCLIEDAATGQRLRNTAQQQQLIHLATHAVFRPDNPMFSWIRLADTRLTVADLYELTLPERPLVVLSACETGRGTPRGGGLLGMGRGLLAAGASGLVLSLWPVADPEAAALMVDFYHELSANRTASSAEALARAQRTAIKRAMPPGAWAAFLYVAA